MSVGKRKGQRSREARQNEKINSQSAPTTSISQTAQHLLINTPQRDKAFNIYPYPCIGQWRFLSLSLGKHPLYPELLTRLRGGDQLFLDLGCAFGQDIRRLVADGVDSAACVGSDLRLPFLDLGYDLFRDRDSLKTRFIEADVFDQSSALAQLDGAVDVVSASSFFHLFSWDEQKAVARRCLRLLKPRKDSLVLGRQVGNVDPGAYARRHADGSRYRHDVASWRRMWDEVGAETGVEFAVEGSLTEEIGFMPDFSAPDKQIRGQEGSRLMTYSVRRMN